MVSQEQKKKNAEYQRKWRARNPELDKECQRRFYLAHPEKKKEYVDRKREFLKQNPEKRREYLENRRPKVKAARAWANKYKLEKGCIDCGYKEHACALHFDHVIGTKRYNISSVRRVETMKAEIEKCVVRCANCHAFKTWSTGQHSSRSRIEQSSPPSSE